MTFLELARAAAWAVRHPRYRQPPPPPEPGDMVSWIERDETGRAVRIYWGIAK